MAVSYCGNCGQAAVDADSFCIACGAHLRRPEDPSRQEVQAPVVMTGGSAPTVSSDDRIVLQHAVDLLGRRQPQTAVVVLERLCAERPDWAVARAYLGIAYLRLTRIADARWELEGAVRIAPESFICRTKLGEFLARLGFYDQALAQLDAALDLGPPDTDSRLAALELRQFCKDKSKGIYYRQTGSLRFGLPKFLSSRLKTSTNAHTEGGV